MVSSGKTREFGHSQDQDKGRFNEGVEALVASYPHLSRVHAISGAPPLRRRPAGFKDLARVIAAAGGERGGNLGTARSARAAFHSHFVPCHPERDLRRAGLSRIKIVTLRGLADAIAGGSLDLDGLTHAPEEEIHARLTAPKGIGPWTADIYSLPGRRGTSRCNTRSETPLSSTPVRASRRWSRSPKPGGRGEASGVKRRGASPLDAMSKKE